MIRRRVKSKLDDCSHGGLVIYDYALTEVLLELSLLDQIASQQELNKPRMILSSKKPLLYHIQLGKPIPITQNATSRILCHRGNTKHPL